MWGLPQSAAKSQPLPAQSYGLWASASAGVEGPKNPSTSCPRERASSRLSCTLCAHARG